MWRGRWGAAGGRANAMGVTVEWARREQRLVLEAMFQLYVHDFSEFWAGTDRGELDESGRFEHYSLAVYWRDPMHMPLLIRAGGHLAGFALLNSKSHGDPVDRNMAEFFVVRKHQRRRGSAGGADDPRRLSGPLADRGRAGQYDGAGVLAPIGRATPFGLRRQRKRSLYAKLEWSCDPPQHCGRCGARTGRQSAAGAARNVRGGLQLARPALRGRNANSTLPGGSPKRA